MNKRDLARGSQWRQWDLHIHTPASFHWSGDKFQGDQLNEHNRKLIDQMIDAMNKSEPIAFAIMDYWTFDGWFLLQERRKEKDAPKLNKVVFPGIELRLAAPMQGRLNAHVLFSNEIQKQALLDFKSALTVELINRPLSNDALIELARQKIGADKLNKHGFVKKDVDNSDETALKAGATVAEINVDSYKTAIVNVPNNDAIGFMPWDTSDGLTEIERDKHYAYAIGLFQSSPIFETRNVDYHAAFAGIKTNANAKYFDNFQTALNHTPRLAVSGSDAHCFVGVQGDNDKRGYGDFPSNKKTWIKADPSFQGLRQAILEPAKRSFIGAIPPKLQDVDANKTYFIDSIDVKKTITKDDVGTWLDGCDIPLNPDLVAIIGNKGSGKSALADVIAMLGNSKQSEHFSFLKKGRFLGQKGKPAGNFEGTLTWCDTSTETRTLNEQPPVEKNELVRYIPQGYFEELCNEHVSGNSNSFERELRAVIFSHTSESMRLGALDFDQLTEQQEQPLRNKLEEYRKELSSINAAIVRMEEQRQPIEQKKLADLLLLKIKQIEEHEKLKPIAVTSPAETLSEEQKQAADKLNQTKQTISETEQRRQKASEQDTHFAKQEKAITHISEKLRLLQRSFEQSQQEVVGELKLLELEWQEIISLSIQQNILDEKLRHIQDSRKKLKEENAKLDQQLSLLTTEQVSLSAKLNEPQQKFETYQRQLADWEKKLATLIGTATEPETRIGLETRIAQINNLPTQQAELEKKRLELSREIFDVLNEQRNAREALYQPVQHLIQQNVLIHDGYKLQFQATLSASVETIANSLFGLIKQTSGEFRGQDDAPATIRRLFDNYDLNTQEGGISFIESLYNKVTEAAQSDTSNVGITNIVRKGATATDVYNLIFGLKFLEPKYTLLFQDTQIEQLSPGQRGALLLIFYLLVDKGKMPIILDQPEENLDNETVYRLLVPVLSEAKKQRQIIMVTHNPNLAVVCDAEQIIHATFDRVANCAISYEAGSIENSTLNERVVTVLEGTKPAFNNRSEKYHK